MDKERFLSFRSDWAKIKDNIANKSTAQVEKIFQQLVEVYPELNMPEEELPALVPKNPRKDHCVDNSVDNVRQKLIASIQDQRFFDYSGFQVVLDNEQTCLESLRTIRSLDAAVDDARKRTIYFSCLQGQVLKRLREITGEGMTALLRLTNYSKSHAYFLIRLYELAETYHKIMYSNLPVRFFNCNFNVIVQICGENVEAFKQTAELYCTRGSRI